eukprot:SAG31_NODE_2236_length_6119_cov_15.764784_1_plen_51_part_10
MTNINMYFGPAQWGAAPGRARGRDCDHAQAELAAIVAQGSAGAAPGPELAA